MKDTIYRDEAVEICERWRQRAKEHNDRDGWYMADTLLKFITEIPSADRPLGKWIIEIDSNGNTYGKCSICDMKQYAGQLNYCPYCGAKMKETNNV